ncbi:MAG: ribosome maturation factor RimP [Clostridia bacterium]|nr:ribosome maturation factor RimP [Clostridia bacterium]
MKVSEIVFEGIKPLFVNDVKLVDVEYVKKNDGMHLIIYIDKEGGITIDDCVAVNHLIDDKLEELDPTGNQPYYLDISSYGLDKPLKFDWQFKKYEGKKVNVKLYHKVDDKKEFVAILINSNEDEFMFSLNDQNFAIKRADVAYITPYIEF